MQTFISEEQVFLTLAAAEFVLIDSLENAYVKETTIKGSLNFFSNDIQWTFGWDCCLSLFLLN